MTADEQRAELERRVEGELAKVYGGVHNCVGWPRRKIRQGIVELSVYDGIATYDCARLTKLVIAAHDECMRVEMLASGPRRLKLYLTLRQRDTDSITTRHPTMEQAIASVRGTEAVTAETFRTLLDSEAMQYVMGVALRVTDDEHGVGRDLTRNLARAIGQALGYDKPTVALVDGGPRP